MRALTMLNITSKYGKSLAVVAGLTLAVSCSRKPADDRSASGALDTAALRTSSSAVTPAVGPGVQVTRTDARSVTRSLDYALTPDFFTKFVAAADSISAIEGRDAATRAHLATNITDAGSTDSEAGLKWLESNDSVSKAISSAGISVRDYYVGSIAIGAASRFLDDPKAAPGTPTLTKNAEFLRSKKTELAHLQALRDHKPLVTSTP